MLQQPPPVWLKDWAQLLIVQVVALVAAIYGLWRWLTHPFYREMKRIDEQANRNRLELERQAARIRGAIGKNSQAMRTDLWTQMGKIVDLEQKVGAVQQAHGYMEEAHLGEVEGVRRELEGVRGSLEQLQRQVGVIDGRLNRIEGMLSAAQKPKVIDV